MLSNLKAEITRKGLEPVKAITSVLECTDKTARNKLNGVTYVTVPEAVKIVERIFYKDNFSIEYLFSDSQAID